jgi:hypothetical protein
MIITLSEIPIAKRIGADDKMTAVIIQKHFTFSGERLIE